MTLIYVVVGIVALSLVLSIPALRYEKRTGKKLGRFAASALMNTVNEIYAPSAYHATATLEQSKERRVAIPSPEDKSFVSAKVVIGLSDEGPSKSTID